MPIEIKVNASARIRQLAREQGLTPEEIRELTGYALSHVKSALKSREARDKPKSRAK